MIRAAIGIFALPAMLPIWIAFTVALWAFGKGFLPLYVAKELFGAWKQAFWGHP